MTGKLTVQTEELFPETRSIENHQNSVRQRGLSRRVPPLPRRAHGRQAASAHLRRLGGRLAHLPGLLPDRSAGGLRVCTLAGARLAAAMADASPHEMPLHM